MLRREMHDFLSTIAACRVRPLTLETLLTELHPTVTPMWQKLGELLAMDGDLLDEIFTNNETDEECLSSMLEVWLEKSTNPTWKHVTDALSESREDGLAEYLYLKCKTPLTRILPAANQVSHSDSINM